MKIIILLIITSAFQSLFGVGVLLFGTPVLLLLGYPFIESLLILLPVSISINILQTSKDYKYVDYKFYKNILVLTIPFIILLLYFVAKININVSFVMGFFLILIALKDYSNIIKKHLNKLLSYNKLFFVLTGIIHGITNLGGSLLTAKIFNADMNKLEKRSTVAISYLTFAVFQIITILSLNYRPNLNNLYYIIIGVSTYLIVNKLVFQKITNNIYDKLFAIFFIFIGYSINTKIFYMVIWLIGISGAGKTTLGNKIHKYLTDKKLNSFMIDGDIVREFYDNDLGYSKEERISNIKRIMLSTYVLEKNNIIPIVCNISPFENLRDFARDKFDSYHEIYLNKNISIAKENDVKGIYKNNFKKTSLIGVDMKFEEPTKSNLTINVDSESEEISFEKIINYINKINS